MRISNCQYFSQESDLAAQIKSGRFENCTKNILHLRGGSAASRLMEQSCYPLHGEGDTEGRSIGSPDDPYSVAAISAAPPKAVPEIERMYLEVLRTDPTDIVVREDPIKISVIFHYLTARRQHSPI